MGEQYEYGEFITRMTTDELLGAVQARLNAQSQG